MSAFAYISSTVSFMRDQQQDYLEQTLLELTFAASACKNPEIVQPISNEVSEIFYELTPSQVTWGK